MTHEAVMTMANWYDVHQVHRKALECTEVSCFELVNCKPTCSLELAEIFTSGNSLPQSLHLAHSAHSALSLHGSCLMLSCASDASPWGEAKAAATWHGQTRQIRQTWQQINALNDLNDVFTFFRILRFSYTSATKEGKKTLQSASRPRHCGRAGLFVLPLVIHQLLIRTSPTSLLLNAFAVTWHSETARKHGKNGKTKVED